MSIDRFKMTPAPLPPQAEALRQKVRDFLLREMDAGTFAPHVSGWTIFDRNFSLRLGEQGWIGITWPKEYGGGAATMLERYVVTEELLAVGAPCASHWPADRQVGPLILRYCNEEQKQRYIPAIVRGAHSFAIGISEPDAGSDVSGIRTRAVPVDGGWRITGRKIWTSNAHCTESMLLLCRTSAFDPEKRHSGLSHFILDLPMAGVTVRPVINMAGEHHFNEVTFDDAFVSSERLVGEAGDGWRQVTSQLALERAGPERFMSNFPLVLAAIDTFAVEPTDRQAAVLGRMLAHAWTLRRMTRSIAHLVSSGHSPEIESALSKEMGTRFERENADALRLAVTDPFAAPTHFIELLRQSTVHGPSFTIRGGSSEILRGIVAKGLGLR